MLPKIFPVACHTDFVGKGTIFVVIQGQNENGLLYVSKALSKGATTIVLEQNIVVSDLLLREITYYQATLKRVDNARVALAQLSAEAAGYPADKLQLIGVTGTKGKTTTVHVLYHLLCTAGFKVASIGTVGNRISTLEEQFKTDLTTPQPDYLHQFFKLCVEQKIKYVVMETAAQATTFCKLETLHFKQLIFTNLDREHGELYPTMESYFQAKASILKKAGPASVLVNVDDQYGKRLSKKNKKHLTFGQQFSTYQITKIDLLNQAFLLNNHVIKYVGSFPGIYNVYNIAAAVAVSYEQGISFENIKKGLQSLPVLTGRFEQYLLSNGATAVIDYAHTPASFKALFQTVQEFTDHLIVVFGAGGGKDHEKRSQMGLVAAEYAQQVVITSDNPRDENPEAIVDEICADLTQSQMKKVYISIDRKKAIEKAYAFSRQGSIILLLGKGPDEYQIIGNMKIPFSEKAILNEL